MSTLDFLYSHRILIFDNFVLYEEKNLMPSAKLTKTIDLIELFFNCNQIFCLCNKKFSCFYEIHSLFCK